MYVSVEQSVDICVHVPVPGWGYGYMIPISDNWRSGLAEKVGRSQTGIAR